MCERLVLLDDKDVIENKYNAVFSSVVKPNYNISLGAIANVITSDNHNLIQQFQFGLISNFSSTKKTIPFARAEGDHNLNDDPDYSGSKGIILKKEFRKQIRSQRCIAIVSAFIVHAESKFYLVHLKNRPFALAGIYNNWKDPNSNEVIHSFALITVPANEILRKINLKRMPVILNDYNASKWINEKLALTSVTSLLNQYPSELMNVYPISSGISNPENNYKDLLKPIGAHLNPELLSPTIKSLPPRTWGHKKKNKSNENAPTMEERRDY